MQKKNITIACIIFVLGIGLGYKLAPVPQSETRTITQDKIVTVVREVKRPDGTVVRDETKTEDRKAEQSIVVAPPVKPDWLVGVSYGFGVVPTYGITVQRRIISNVYVGASASTVGDVTLNVGVTF